MESVLRNSCGCEDFPCCIHADDKENFFSSQEEALDFFGEEEDWTCPKCGIDDCDESHWTEDGQHICDADW